ncbi:MAG: hypothetical protein JNL92_02940 [Opitutaceae bacterium]|nr:hypothetical protein [Opitutaceae bacterium]
MTADPREPNLPPDPPSHPPPPVAPGSDPAIPTVELTPEEQMERFARELKETDWGHQPC